MRHKKSRGRLSRNASHRKACLRNLVRNLLLHEKIRTTLSKAKEARRLADKLISLGKQNSLYARRRAYRVLEDRRLIQALFKEISPRFKTRVGGYTRIMQTSARKGDNARMAILELTEKAPSAPAKEKTKEKAAPEKPSAPKLKAPPEKLKEFKGKPKPLKKPKGFIRDLRSFFKKERDSL